jgi:hypothetical protein
MAVEAPGAAEASVTSADDVPTKLKQLAELHSAGILTDEEFETKKSELLSRM